MAKTQRRLTAQEILEEEDRRQLKGAEKRLNKKVKDFAKNFYVLDCETNGFKHNEPVQIAVLRFEKGKEVEKHLKYFVPDEKFTK